jgi:hypothetical protein
MSRYSSPYWPSPLSEKYFCLSTGSCGSAYIVELMKANGYDRCYHEQRPELDNAGVKYYLQRIDPTPLKRILYFTRIDTFFESSNRLFSLSRLIYDIFPNSHFIHLFRNGYSQINSTLNKKIWPSTFQKNSRLRYASHLAGPQDASPFERTCWYWRNYNERILQDLADLPHVKLKFRELINGDTKKLEEMLRRPFSVRRIAPVNTKEAIKRRNKRFDSHLDWPSEYHRIFRSVCGETMSRLGYKLH